MLDRFLAGWLGLRARWRGLALPVFALPLLPAALFFALGGEERGVLGCLLGFGAALLALRVLRRGRHGDARRASWLVAIGTGLAAHLAAGLGHLLPVLLGAGALLGTRLLYEALPETAPPPPPAPSPPQPSPQPYPQPSLGPIAASRARLALVAATAARLGDPGLQAVVTAMAGVLDDLTARPDRLPQARRFLAVHLDGLERITARLEAGAAPPPGLPALLEELTRTAGELRERLRHEETAALEIQVKVLSDRLREEGFR